MLPRLTKTEIAGSSEAYVLSVACKKIGAIARQSSGPQWLAIAGVGKAARHIGVFPRKLDAMKAVVEDSRQRIERLVDEFRQANELQ